MKATVNVLNELVAERVLGQYAIGGAMAAMFYIEPVATFDLDIFVRMPVTAGGLITLGPLYGALQQRGYIVKDECIVVEGVPVQFLPAHNELTEEALEAAIGIMIDEVPARVFRIEHLLAIAIQTGRNKDRERIRMLCESSAIDQGLLMDICTRHRLPVPRIGTTE